MLHTPLSSASDQTAQVLASPQYRISPVKGHKVQVVVQFAALIYTGADRNPAGKVPPAFDSRPSYMLRSRCSLDLKSSDRQEQKKWGTDRIRCLLRSNDLRFFFVGVVGIDGLDVACVAVESVLEQWPAHCAASSLAPEAPCPVLKSGHDTGARVRTCHGRTRL